MARRFLDDVRADINAAIVPNGAGTITADVLRPLLIDSIDSSIEDEAVLSNSAEIVDLTVTDTGWTIAPLDVAAGGDGQFLNVDLPSSSISTSPVAGYTYKVQAAVSLTGSNNAVCELAILEGGLPVGVVGYATLRGNAKPVSITALDLTLATPASTPYSMALRLIGTPTADLDIKTAALLVTIKPTNNP